MAKPRPLLTLWFGVSRSGETSSSRESSEVADDALLRTGELDADRSSGVSSVALSSARDASLELTCSLKAFLEAEPPEASVWNAMAACR